MDNSSKRSKVSTLGAYSPSSKPETTIKVDEYETTSPISRPIG